MLNGLVSANVRVDPNQFYALLEIAGSKFPDEVEDRLREITLSMDSLVSLADDNANALSQSVGSFMSEVRRFTKRRKNPFDPVEDEDFDNVFRDFRHTVDGKNFLPVIFQVMKGLRDTFREGQSILKDFKPITPVVVGDKVGRLPKNLEELQALSIQIQMNDASLNRFMTSVSRARSMQDGVVKFARTLSDFLGEYHAVLVHRHSTEGVKIHGSPVATDLAMSIFENVDANGEIQDGRTPDEVSAYAVRKAEAVVNSIRTGVINDFVMDPSSLIEHLRIGLVALWSIAKHLHGVAAPLDDKIREVTGMTTLTHKPMTDSAFNLALESLSDLDPNLVTYKEKAGMMTSAERHELEYMNGTLSGIVSRIRDENVTSSSVIRYVLDRKHELRQYHLEENSFFVCKIGAGNPFSGEAPGELQIVPGTKPNVSLNDVHGSGFDEVKDFIKHVTAGTKWFDLFVATSPSKKADKSNVLLVGPQGSGKTEILRAVASDKGSIGIFAQASDFLTCWKGEAEKNPKRLFEGGLKIQRESGKLVFFLIDEIDTILNGDRGHFAFGGTNLATEFQVLMDGIMSYPSLALWGATNHPERIPMPLIRRFAKVVIVGELDQAARVRLLKQFASHMPVSRDFPEQAWNEAGELLNGAVGDVIRKTVDHLWRSKMAGFIHDRPKEAEELVNILNHGGERFDVANFNSGRRAAFNERLRPFVEVTPKDLLDSIRSHLDNVAIRTEIQKCVETYDNAREFLAGLKSQ